MSRVDLITQLKFAQHYTHPSLSCYTGTLSMEQDHSEAVAFFVNGIEDDPYCQNNLAIFFALGLEYPQNLDKSLSLLTAAAAQQLPQAFYNLGLLEYNLLIPRVSPPQTRFQRALMLGVKEASYFIGRAEENRIGREAADGNAMDRSEALGEARVRALRHYAIAAEVDYPPALCRMGDIYHREADVRDDALALKYYTQAADGGDLAAMLAAADLYLSGYSPALSNAPYQPSAFFICPTWDSKTIAAFRSSIVEQTRNPEAAIAMLNKAIGQHASPVAYEKMGDISKDLKGNLRAAATYYYFGGQKGNIACLAKCGEMFLLCEAIRHKGMAKDMFVQFKARLAELPPIKRGELADLLAMTERYLEEIKPPSRKKKPREGADASGQGAE